MPRQNRSEGKILVILAVLMLGGAAFMLGKAWYLHSQEKKVAEEITDGLTALRYMSPKNILDRIAKNEELQFIDVRPREAFDRDHIIDSDWLGLAEIAYYNAPAGKLVIIVYGEENSNDQLREINALYTKKGLSFAFLEGGIRNWVAEGGGLVSEADPASFLDRTKIIPIEPENVITLQESLVRSTILDVRTDREFAAGHIPGAINIPLSRLEKERGTIPSIGSLFVYGDTETDSFQAGAKLFDMGYIGLRVITGGYTAWKEKGLPVEKK